MADNEILVARDTKPVIVSFGVVAVARPCLANPRLTEIAVLVVPTLLDDLYV